MTEDAELLRRYTEESSDSAFAELVQRHLALVYNVALRKVAGDAHLAQDVAQGVFIDLARKAASLADRATLTGWLFTSTHYAAAKAVRGAQRRRNREQEAQLMRELSPEENAVGWDRLRPLLDDLIRELPEREREAVLLRFFGEQDFPAMGAKLQLSPDGARTRVNRALERLQVMLARRGVKSTTAALAGALIGQTSAAPPVGLAATVTSGALASAAVGGGAVAGFAFMSTKIIMGIAGAVVVASAVTVIIQQQSAGQLRAELENLRTENRAMAALRRQNDELAAAARAAQGEAASLQGAQAEAERLRGELNTWKARATEAAAKAAAPNPVEAVKPMTVATAWVNAGRGTPAAAYETELWAARRGNLEEIANSLAFTPAARARAERAFAGMPAEVHAQYSTPERMSAFLLSGSPDNVTQMEIASVAQTSPDEAKLVERHFYENDERMRENTWIYRRAPDGSWQRIIDEPMVAKWEMLLKRGALQVPPVK